MAEYVFPAGDNQSPVRINIPLNNLPIATQVNCEKCACLLLIVNVESHMDWHKRQEDALQALLDLITNQHAASKNLIAVVQSMLGRGV
jgi:hypothetical protein